MPSGESTARVRALTASLPEVDSESAYAPIHSPEASFGRYFCFCAGVPYQTIGSVPMPVCAREGDGEAGLLADGFGDQAEVTLSMPRPPYSSGTSTAMRPSSPALRSRARVTAKFLASISAAAGSTSLVVNSSAVLAICRCSSVKSSGVKTSSRAALLEEEAAAAPRAGRVVLVAIFLSSRALQMSRRLDAGSVRASAGIFML